MNFATVYKATSQPLLSERPTWEVNLQIPQKESQFGHLPQSIHFFLNMNRQLSIKVLCGKIQNQRKK